MLLHNYYFFDTLLRLTYAVVQMMLYYAIKRFIQKMEYQQSGNETTGNYQANATSPKKFFYTENGVPAER